MVSTARDRAGGLDHLAPRRERERHAVDLAADELVGTAGDGRDDEAVGPARDGVGTEHDAARVGNEEGLDEHRHAARDRQTLVHGFAARDDGAHCVDEAVPAAHVEHGLEAAGHRRVDAVFDGGRGADDERLAAVLGELGPCAASLGEVVARGDRVGRVGRQHEAGQDREARLVGVRERRGLRAGGFRVGCVRQAHDRAFRAELRIGADHRNSSSCCRDCGVNGVDRNRLVVHGPRPRLEAQLGGATEVGVSEDGVHLAGLDAKRPSPSEHRCRALVPAQRLDGAGAGGGERVHGVDPSGDIPVMLRIIGFLPWGTLADG